MPAACRRARSWTASWPPSRPVPAHERAAADPARGAQTRRHRAHLHPGAGGPAGPDAAPLQPRCPPGAATGRWAGAPILAGECASRKPAVPPRGAAGPAITRRGPRNHFALAPAARHHLLLAGGIGITPLLSMAQHLANPAQQDSGASFSLHYAARSRAQAAYLERLAEPDLAAQVHHHFDDGPPEQGLDLNALLAQPEPGVPLMTACLQGVCGTCLTPVLAGQPNHRDAYLSADEKAANQQFLPCCSRSLSARLVLDL